MIRLALALLLVVLLPGCVLFELSVSRDGVIAVGDGHDLVLIPTRGGTRPARRIPLGMEVRETAWSPDGTTVAVTARREAGAGQPAMKGLWLVRRRDGATRLLHRGELLRPAWSADGRRLGVLSFRPSPGSKELEPPDLKLIEIASGRVAATLAGVVAFDWHPSADRMAVIALPTEVRRLLGEKVPTVELQEVDLGAAPVRRSLDRFEWPLLQLSFPTGLRYVRSRGPQSAPDRILFAGKRGGTAADPKLGLFSLDLARKRVALLGGDRAPLLGGFSVSPSRTRVVASAVQAGDRGGLYRVSLAGQWTRVGPRSPRTWRRRGQQTRGGTLAAGWICEDVLATQPDARTITRLDLRDGRSAALYEQLYRPGFDLQDLFSKRKTRRARTTRPAPRIRAPAHPVVAKLGPFVELVRQRWQQTLEAPPTGLWNAGRFAIATRKDAFWMLDGETGRVRKTDRLSAPLVGGPFRMGGVLGALDATGRLVGRPVRRGRTPALGLVPSSPALGGTFVHVAVRVGTQHQFGAFHARDYRWHGRYVLDAPLAGPPVETFHGLFVLTRSGQAMGFSRHAVDGLLLRWRRQLQGAPTRLASSMRSTRDGRLALAHGNHTVPGERLWALGERTVTRLDPLTGAPLGRVGPGWSSPRVVSAHHVSYLLGLDGETPCLGRLTDGAPLTWRREHVDRLVAANATRLYAMSGRELLELDAASGAVVTRVTLPPEVVHVAGGPGGPGEPLLLGLADGTVIRLDVSE